MTVRIKAAPTVNYNGAGIVAHVSKDSVIRFERGNPAAGAVQGIIFNAYMNGQTFGEIGPVEFKATDLYLRLERKGSTFTGYAKPYGSSDYQKIGQHNISDFPNTVEAGIGLINQHNDGVFSAQFSEFSLFENGIELTNTGGAGTGSGTVPSGTSAGSTLAWIGMTEDKVSPGPDKDGSPDAHFALTLNPGGSKTVNYILLESTDAKGTPAGGQYWDTDPNVYWILGVEQPAGTRLNPTDKSIAKAITGSTTFELYASNSGYFKAGQYFKAEARYSDGTKSEALMMMPAAPAKTTTTLATQTTTAPNSGNNAAGPGDELIIDTSNHYLGGCGKTDTSKWTLDSDTQVAVFEVWHYWNSGEQTILFSIKKDGADFASGTLYRSSCDPYQTSWCNADLRINKVFTKGSYVATIQSARACRDDKGNGVVRLYGPKAATQTTTAAPTTLPNTGTISTTSKICTPGAPYVYIEDRTVDRGKEVLIPVIMCNAVDLANMDLSINYNTQILTYKDTEKGSLNAKSLLESNEKPAGTIKISFAANQGTSGDGSIAILAFLVGGSSGQSSAIAGTVNSASTSAGSPLNVNVRPGGFTVGTGPTGDCDGDGIVSSRDALAALQMSVEKIATDLCYDVTGDGIVDSSDARELLKKAVGG